MHSAPSGEFLIQALIGSSASEIPSVKQHSVEFSFLNFSCSLVLYRFVGPR